MIALERESLAVMRHQLELGAIAEADVLRAGSGAGADWKPRCRRCRSSWTRTRDLLAALTGRLPAEFAALSFELDQLTLPAEIPLGVPSQLVERRPDVRAAEAQLHCGNGTGRRGHRQHAAADHAQRQCR